jgi:hypothetical protein
MEPYLLGVIDRNRNGLVPIAGKMRIGVRLCERHDC